MMPLNSFINYFCRNVSTFFSWKNSQVFRVQPKSGQLEPNETCRLNAIFCPESAKVYNSYAVCSFGKLSLVEEHNLKDLVHTKVVKMEGIGKYPFVAVKRGTKIVTTIHVNDKQIPEKVSKEITVDFGSVAVGGTVEKWIAVDNPSPV